jgi:hypothetical protein
LDKLYSASFSSFSTRLQRSYAICVLVRDRGAPNNIKSDCACAQTRTGTPPEFWLLYTLYATYVYNLLSVESLNGQIPTQVTCAFTPDVSALPYFDITIDNPNSHDGELSGIDMSHNLTGTIYANGDIVTPGFDPAELKLPRFSIEELLGQTFILDQPDGQQVQAEVIRKINDQDAANHENIKVLCKVGDD